MKKFILSIVVLFFAASAFAQQDTTKKALPLATGTNEELIPYKPGSETIRLRMPKEQAELPFAYDLDQDGTITEEELRKGQSMQVDNCLYILQRLNTALDERNTTDIEAFKSNFDSYGCKEILENLIESPSR